MNIVRRFLGNRNGALATSDGRHYSANQVGDTLIDRLWHELDAPWFFRMPMLSQQGSFWPAMDVAEDDHAVTFRFDLPGLEPGEVDVEVTDHTLTIRGRREEHSEDARTLVQERLIGHFERIVSLPDYIDPEHVEARHQNGVLTITAPKVASRAPRKVRIAA